MAGGIFYDFNFGGLFYEGPCKIKIPDGCFFKEQQSRNPPFFGFVCDRCEQRVGFRVIITGYGHKINP